MDDSDKLEVYKRSNYKWIKEFAIQYPVWNKDIIKDRAKNMASLYFEKILRFKKF